MQTQTHQLPSVLTLEEAADYLRLSPEVLVEQATAGKIPGQPIDNTWRFLKSALDHWLGHRDGRTILLQQAGIFAHDDTLEELQRQIDRDRQQSTFEMDD
ncbi:MAG: helix-turn-helix domain-containing protein [Oculatellaceae cyanobacterium Prado106]|nr:helix-turn-helix domain-containing protein [Oculatellaceae cyanobacterium Prado106]